MKHTQKASKILNCPEIQERKSLLVQNAQLEDASAQRSPSHIRDVSTYLGRSQPSPLLTKSWLFIANGFRITMPGWLLGPYLREIPSPTTSNRHSHSLTHSHSLSISLHSLFAGSLLPPIAPVQNLSNNLLSNFRMSAA